MKKINIIAPHKLPIPSIQGGAIETLIDYFIKENEYEKNFLLNIFSYDGKNRINNKNEQTTYIYTKRGLFTKFKTYINYMLNIQFFCPTIISNALKYDSDAIIIEGNKYYIQHIPLSVNAKIFLHIHHEAFRERNRLNTIILERLDCVICVSEYIKKVCITAYPEYQDKFVVLKNCCSNEFFEIEHNRERMKIRNRYNILDNDFVVTFIGRITKEKGVKELLQAIETCSDNVILLMIGNSSFGAKKPSAYMNEVKNLMHNSTKRIIFTGQINHSDIPKYLAASDVQVVPSIWEDPAPLAVIEGIVSNIPLIVTNSGGIPEYLPQNYKYIAKKEKELSVQLKEMIGEIQKNGKNEILDDLNNIKNTLTTKEYYKNYTSIINYIINEGCIK